MILFLETLLLFCSYSLKCKRHHLARERHMKVVRQLFTQHSSPCNMDRQLSVSRGTIPPHAGFFWSPLSGELRNLTTNFTSSLNPDPCKVTTCMFATVLGLAVVLGDVQPPAVAVMCWLQLQSCEEKKKTYQ